MSRRPPRPTRTDPRFPYATLFRSFQAVSETTHFIIATDIGMSRVPAGQQHATGRSTDGNAGIMLGKAHPFNSHTVQIWCIDLLLPVTTQLTVPQVIGINVDDFRMIFRLYRSEEHTSELQSLMRISYAVFCLNKKNR